MIYEARVLRLSAPEGSLEELRDAVAVEEETRLYVNGRLLAALRHSPAQVREMVVGYLLTEGVVGCVDEVLEVELREGEARVKVLEGPPRARPSAGEVRFSAAAVLRAVETLGARASVFKATGGTHAAAVADREGGLASFAEDVSRHSALDKAVGGAALRGVDLSQSMLALSGRLTYEVVSKAARAGVPVVASISAPTSGGIAAAEAAGLTLIGFVREGRLNVYTSPDRVEECARALAARRRAS